MMKPALPGWTVECVGDDIAWMKFDSQGQRSYWENGWATGSRDRHEARGCFRCEVYQSL
uniref:Phosphoenolpyruvate carboxykinase C-terminal P-loop domain-containing protein n=1 Tax=Anguilla anguilla TaxID=7936 RepID=A0A0E9RN31_ANGAN